MTDKQPTQEQIKKFWEWYGARCLKCGGLITNIIKPARCNCYAFELDIDLNNLFKYAVPKLTGEYWLTFEKAWDAPHLWLVGIKWVHRKDDEYIYGSDEDPALALFWALHSLIDGFGIKQDHYEQKEPIAEFTSPIYAGEEAVRMQKRLDRPELNEIKETLVKASLVDGFAQYITPETIERIAKKLLALIPDIEEAIRGAKQEVWTRYRSGHLTELSIAVEEAKREERERIIRDLEELHRPDYRVKDVIVYLKYRLGIKQALKGEK